MNIAASYQRSFSLQTICKPFLASLATELHQTIQLAVWNSGSTIYIEQALSDAPLNVLAPLYKPVANNTSAAAKVLINYLPQREKETAIQNCPYVRLTGRTITDPDLFRNELENVRKQGYAIDDEEFSIGIGCLAVPIFGNSSNCVAALGITGQIKDYRDPETFKKMLQALNQTSQQISASLQQKSL
jgi:DNA-binding IclR family transcriptional regulator